MRHYVDGGDDWLTRPLEYLVDPIESDGTPPPPYVPSGPGFVYVVKSLDLFKIGLAADLHQCLNGLKSQGAAEVTLLFSRAFAAYPVAWKSERAMHALFAAQRHHGEWFALTEADLATLRTALEAYDAK